MSKFLHGFAHVLLVGLQYANAASGIIPSPYQPIVATALALVQGVLALSHHTAPAPVQGSLNFGGASKIIVLMLCLGLLSPVAFGRAPQTTAATAPAPAKSSIKSVFAHFLNVAPQAIDKGLVILAYVSGKVDTVSTDAHRAVDAAVVYLENVR